MVNTTVTFGADPEFTIFDDNNDPVPAHTIGIPDKSNPIDSYAAIGLGGCDIHRDGWNVELNPLATTCRESLCSYIGVGLKTIKQRYLPPGYEIRPVSAYKVDLRRTLDAPVDVCVFGCEPAMDAYSGYATIVPLDAMTHEWRYAGGHMHFGDLYRKELYKGNAPASIDQSKHNDLAKLMDYYLGLMLRGLYNGREQTRRRKWYGKAGEYRTQPHGFEYRTPPPEMWRHSAIVSLAYGVGRMIIESFDTLLSRWDKAREPDIQHAINTGENVWALMPSLSPWYTPEAIQKIRIRKDLKEFVFLREGDIFSQQALPGWQSYLFRHPIA